MEHNEQNNQHDITADHHKSNEYNCNHKGHHTNLKRYQHNEEGDRHGH